MNEWCFEADRPLRSFSAHCADGDKRLLNYLQDKMYLVNAFLRRRVKPYRGSIRIDSHA